MFRRVRHRSLVLILVASCMTVPAIAVQPPTACAEGMPPPLSRRPGGFEAEATPKYVQLDPEDRVIELVNEARWANGQLPPLSGCDLLDDSSELHSGNMADRDFFMHCDPDTLTLPWDRMVSAGYSYSTAAENIAAGYTTPEDVMAGWMASPGHRSNILSTASRELGIGYVLETGDTGNVRSSATGQCPATVFGGGPYFRYWTQNFGSRSSVYPIVIDREAAETDIRDVALYIYGSGWAQDMRLRNESGAWSAWQPFAANLPWQLSVGAGTKTVEVEIRNGATVLWATDAIVLTAAGSLIFKDGFESGDTALWDDVVAP